MERERPRWRFRISTLMLLVIIAALTSALVVERWKRTVEQQRALVYAQKAEAEARRALVQSLRQAQAQQALVQARRAEDEAKGSVSIPRQETPTQATQAGAQRKVGDP